MNLKNAVRPFVPPILWSALSRLKTPPSSEGPKRSLIDVVVGNEFTVPFSRVTTERGVYFVPKYAEHRPACKAILDGDLYEPETHDLIDKILHLKRGSIVHAGTFFGDMLPTFARSCPATVYAFEPVLESYILAKLCVEANSLENVFILNAGLSDRISIAQIDTGSTVGNHLGGGSTLSDEGQCVGLVTIDSLDLQDLVVIQLDVEGHELQALHGARDTIERSSPIILIEDVQRNCSSYLEEIGYKQARTLPGVFVWVRPVDESLIDEIIPPKK